MNTFNPLSEYIDDLTEGHGYENFEELIIKRNNFGKLPLELGQFIPVKDGKPLEKPVNNRGFLESDEKFNIRFEEYETALSKVLFEGWRIGATKDNQSIIVLVGGKGHCICYNIQDSKFYTEIGAMSEHSYISTIESISYLNLILTKEGEKKLI